MKENEVPQELGALGGLTELCYATDEEGNYTTLQSVGWDVKTTAIRASMVLFAEQMEEARQQALSGKRSALPYYMLKNRMDYGVLAASVGLPVWLVKLHSRPFFFKRLSKRRLAQYAEVLGITVEELTSMRGE
jgi:hypothetical protein